MTYLEQSGTHCFRTRKKRSRKKNLTRRSRFDLIPCYQARPIRYEDQCLLGHICQVSENRGLAANARLPQDRSDASQPKMYFQVRSYFQGRRVRRILIPYKCHPPWKLVHKHRFRCLNHTGCVHRARSKYKQIWISFNWTTAISITQIELILSPVRVPPLDQFTAHIR